MPDERGSDQQRKLIVDCPIKVCGTAIPSPFSYSPHCYISPAVQIYKGSWAGKTKHKVGSRNKQGPALEFDQVEIWPQCVAQNSWLWFFRPHTIWHPEFKHLQHGFGLQTLPKAQRTRGLSSSCQSNFLRSYHKFKHKSWSNIFRISTKHQLQNLNQTKLKLKSLDQT